MNVFVNFGPFCSETAAVTTSRIDAMQFASVHAFAFNPIYVDEVDYRENIMKTF